MVKDGIGNGIGKCLVHDDIGLSGFSMEFFHRRRDQKVKKGLGVINMVELRKNRALLLDEGYGVQVDMTIGII